MRLRKEWGEIKPSAALAGGRGAGSVTRGSSLSNLNRQIRSMAPGQTIRGEIVSRNGNEVQIKLADDTVIQAKIDQNMNLEVGKNMTFEIRNNGSALTLSPLFENVSADVNVLKALDMAGLPVNETSVSMTAQLMKAGLPVDRNSLQQVYRELASFPQADISDVVNLHKLGLPVNETNVNQMIAYRELNHQLLGGMESVLEALPEAMEGMFTEGNLLGLSGLYQELFDMLTGAGEGPAQAQEEAELSGTAAEAAAAELQEDAHVGATPQAAADILLEELSAGEGSGAISEGVSDGGQTGAAAAQVMEGNISQGDGVLSAASRAQLSEQLLQMLSELPLSQEESAQIASQLRQFAQGTLGTDQLFALAGRLMDAARTAENGVQNLHQIFSGREFHELLAGQLKNLWTIKPDELNTPGKVEELYRRMDRQLKGLTQALENGGQAESTAYRATTSMSQNIDFLNQLNQMYAYVQLPLRMLNGEMNGELYVFTNKRNLAANEGKISALLHLDMEHLGPVDVYVVMEHSKVNTRFYVQDDDMLDFLGKHMDILTKRLADRGYDCSFSLTARGEEQEENSGVAPLLRQEKGVLLSQYAFDMRA